MVERSADEALFREAMAALSTVLSDRIILRGAWLGAPGELWVEFRASEAPHVPLGAVLNTAWAVAGDAEASGVALAWELLEVGWIATDYEPRTDQFGVQWMLAPERALPSGRIAS